MKVEVHPGYALLTIAYLAGIAWLSSIPDLGVSSGDPLAQLASNLFHIPLYAGLTFCLLRTISAGTARAKLPWVLSGFTLLATGTYAALDEWHQSFVPGRYASPSDFLLDLLGILAMLLVLRLEAPGEEDS